MRIVHGRTALSVVLSTLYLALSVGRAQGVKVGPPGTTVTKPQIT